MTGKTYHKRCTIPRRPPFVGGRCPRHIDRRFAPYVAQASTPRQECRAKDTKDCALFGTRIQTKSLIDKEIVKHLRWPEPTNRVLGDH